MDKISEMIKILLADDHHIVRNGIKMLLETQANFKVVGEAANSKEAVMAIKANPEIDIVLSEMHIPEMDIMSLITEVEQLHENIKVVILSMYDQEKQVIQAFFAGAVGYLLKSIKPEELIFALNFIHQGGKYLCAELSMKLIQNLIVNHQNRPISTINIGFSLREIEVLQLIAQGLTNSEISEKLFISKRTVEGHRQSLIGKTKVNNTAALIRFAVLNGLIA